MPGLGISQPAFEAPQSLLGKLTQAPEVGTLLSSKGGLDSAHCPVTALKDCPPGVVQSASVCQERLHAAGNIGVKEDEILPTHLRASQVSGKLRGSMPTPERT